MNVRRVLSRLLVLYPLALLLSAPAEASIPSSPAPAIARADDARGASLTLSSDQEPSALFAGVSLDPEQSPSVLVADSSARLFESVSLLDSQPRRAPPDFTPETRIGVISFFGQPVLAVHHGASLELHWGSGGLFSKTAMGLGDPDSANTYVWGVAGPWASDPLGLEGSGPGFWEQAWSLFLKRLGLGGDKGEPNQTRKDMARVRD